MSNPRCVVCGNVNRLGAQTCEMCDSRLDGSQGFGASEGRSYFYGEEPRAGALPTDIPSPHFQGAGDIIGPTLELYRKQFTLVGLLVLATALPLALFHYAAYGLVIGFDGPLSVRAGGMSGSGLVAFAAYWAVTFAFNAVLAGAVVYAVVELRRAGTARASACLAWGVRKMPKVFAVNLIYYAIIYGVPALLIGASAVALGPLAVIVFLLCVLPWVVLSLMLSLVVPAAAVENRGVFESFKRSAELTWGYKGLIFFTCFLWTLLTTAVTLIVSYSFAVRGGGWSSAGGYVLQGLFDGLLKSATYVLMTYIFLGILKEKRQSFGAQAAAR